MTGDQYIMWLRERIEEFPDAIAMPAAQAAVNIVRKRVEDDGRTSEGGSFSSYSKAYSKKIHEEGRRTVFFKNFYDTGVMWNSFGMKDRIDLPGETIIKCRMDNEVRESGDTNQEIMEKHSRDEGIDIIAISDEEEKEIKEFVDKELARLWG